MTRDNLKGRLVDCSAALLLRSPREKIRSAGHESIPERDSMASVALLATLQQEFHLDGDFTELDHLLCVDRALAYLEEQIPVERQADGV